MAGPLVGPLATQLIPESRFYNALRTTGWVICAPLLLGVIVAGWFFPSLLALRILSTVSVLLALPVGTYIGMFRWTPVRTSSRRDGVTDTDERWCFSRMAASHGAADSTVYGAGWVRCGADGVSVWVADSSWSFHSPARCIAKVPWVDVGDVSREVFQQGRACSRLRIGAHPDRVFDIGLTHPSGRSISGASDAYIDTVVTRLTSTRDAATGASTGRG